MPRRIPQLILRAFPLSAQGGDLVEFASVEFTSDTQIRNILAAHEALLESEAEAHSDGPERPGHKTIEFPGRIRFFRAYANEGADAEWHMKHEYSHPAPIRITEHVWDYAFSFEDPQAEPGMEGRVGADLLAESDKTMARVDATNLRAISFRGIQTAESTAPGAPPFSTIQVLAEALKLLRLWSAPEHEIDQVFADLMSVDPLFPLDYLKHKGAADDPFHRVPADVTVPEISTEALTPYLMSENPTVRSYALRLLDRTTGRERARDPRKRSVAR